MRFWALFMTSAVPTTAPTRSSRKSAMMYARPSGSITESESMNTQISPLERRMPSAIAARLPRFCENWTQSSDGCRSRAASMRSQVRSPEPSSTTTTSIRSAG